ncbi:hypothetical protein ACWGS9_34360 [Bradyrhizobium sp. Arg314]
MLNLLYLVDKGLLDIPVLYLSRFIIGNKRAYYDRLLAVTTESAWEDWILYMLEAIRETANWSTARIRPSGTCSIKPRSASGATCRKSIRASWPT